MLRILQLRKVAQPLKPFVRNYYIKPPKMGPSVRNVLPVDPVNYVKYTVIFTIFIAVPFYTPFVALFYMKNKMG